MEARTAAEVSLSEERRFEKLAVRAEGCYTAFASDGSSPVFLPPGRFGCPA